MSSLAVTFNYHSRFLLLQYKIVAYTYIDTALIHLTHTHIPPQKDSHTHHRGDERDDGDDG